MLTKSNQKYSFPKTSRFQDIKKEYKDVFYNIPSQKENRASALGYGTKMAFGNQKSITPGPGKYVITSQFQRTGQSIGLGRDCVKSNSYIPKSQFDVGPGQFQIQDTNQKKSYSMAGRYKDINKMDYIPGPGQYPIQSTITADGTYCSSRLENSCCKKFNPPSSQRFFEKASENPGPGKYSPSFEKNKGSYYLSNLQSIQGQTIGKKEREFFKTKNQNPGPGAYPIQSQF